MPHAPKPSMSPANTVTIDSHAAATLRYIRASMDAAAQLAVPGSAGVSMGAVGLVAAALASTRALREHWLDIWLIAASVAALVGGTLMARQAWVQGLTLFGAPVRRFLMCLLPSLAAGAVLTIVHRAHGNLHAIPGTWLLLYGCALISASAPTSRIIAVLGGSFVTLGLIAFLLPDALQILMLGAGFGGLHVLFGLWLARASHGR